MKYILPCIILAILFTGLKNRVSVYSEFSDGALNGMKTVAGILPVILAMTAGVSMLKASGLMGFIAQLLSPVTVRMNIPPEVLPLILVRPFSGGGSLGVLSGILDSCGADSYPGLLASIIMGSCETTFYTLMVYFKNTRVKHTARIIPAAVFGDIVCVAAGVVICLLFPI